ncbi:MAG: hypothetical protein KC609_12340 [Myxococcales bacterium]|nr:hypothetical protein [Myxococcales bacterium]
MQLVTPNTTGKRSHGALAALALASLGLALLCFSSVASAQCPRYWNPVRTNGLNYMVTLNGDFGLLWGKNRDDNLNMGSYVAGLNLDARGYLGMVTFGVAGDFQFGKHKSHYQIVDAHIGINISETGLAGYKYILSHFSMRVWNVQYSRTRWCAQTQGTARHHQLTTGPKFIFTYRGKGAGAHLTYRFTQVWTRSNMAWYAEAQFNYGNLNAFSNGSAFSLTKKGSAHAYGGKVSLNYIWSYTNSGFSIGYFAGAWNFMMNVGIAFWGA